MCIRDRATAARELQNLTKLRIRELLSDDEYLKERKELERQQLGVVQKLDILAKRDARFAPSQDIVSFNNCLIDRFQKGTLQKKRMILATVGSHLVLTDKKLNIDARKPFRRWTKSANVSDLRAFVRDIRTHCGGDVYKRQIEGTALKRGHRFTGLSFRVLFLSCAGRNTSISASLKVYSSFCFSAIWASLYALPSVSGAPL